VESEISTAIYFEVRGHNSNSDHLSSGFQLYIRFAP